MNDLISRAAAIEALGERPHNWTDSDSEIAEVCAWESHKSAIESVPAVDAVPVVHARWIDCSEYNDGTVCRKCSECQDMQIHYYTYCPNYCPNCGAKMDGDADVGTGGGLSNDYRIN